MVIAIEVLQAAFVGLGAAAVVVEKRKDEVGKKKGGIWPSLAGTRK